VYTYFFILGNFLYNDLPNVFPVYRYYLQRSLFFWFSMNCLVLFCLVLSCCALSCPALPCPVLSCNVMSCYALHCPILSCPVMSCHVMPCYVMECHVLFCLALYSFVAFCMMFYVFCVVLCVVFCTGNFVMVPLKLNLTYLHCLQHYLLENLFNSYFLFCLVSMFIIYSTASY